jgi:hypothetical protein
METYISTFIRNLPESITSAIKPIPYNLVLDGGMFNGSYLIGSLYFLKEMEKRKYISIQKISGCSIGAFCAFLYLNDALDLFFEIYEILLEQLKTKGDMNQISYMVKLLKERIHPKQKLKHYNGRFFVTYYDMKKYCKVIRNKYHSLDDVIECIIRSSFLPFIINGECFYQNRFMDGINPYKFSSISNKPFTKTIYLRLITIDKLNDICNVKNEHTAHHRALSGLLEIHNFFIKGSATNMCCFMDELRMTDYMVDMTRTAMEYFTMKILYCICWIYKLSGYNSEKSKENNINSITIVFKKIVFETYCILLKHYLV